MPIGEREEMAAALFASDEAFRAAFRNASIGMCVMSIDGYWINVNQSLCDMLGYDEQELTSKTYLDLTHPDDIEISRVRAEQLRNGDLTYYHLEKRYVHSDGHSVWANCSVTPRCDAHGNPLHYITMIEDISERKQAEAVLQSSHEKLRELVAHQERIKENERIRIARELHDELGGSLTACKATLSVAMIEEERAGRTPNQRLMDSCALLDTAIDTVRKVITDLRPSVLDHLGVWAALEWHAEQTQARTGIVCRVAIDDAVRDSVVDAERSTSLFRILQETLTNVTRHAEASEVEIRVTKKNGMICMQVEDNGKGIDAKQLSMGTSWGIAGMVERARYFSGDIAVSNTSHGTRVTLRLPQTSLDKAGFAQLVWHDRFCCGNQILDSQHLSLFNDSNRLLAAILSNDADEEIRAAVDTLMRDLAHHFHEEEKLLVVMAYPHAAAHAAKHDLLLQNAAELVERFRSGNLGVGTLFQFLAHDLVANHMLNEDRDFYPYLTRKRTNLVLLRD